MGDKERVKCATLRQADQERLTERQRERKRGKRVTGRKTKRNKKADRKRKRYRHTEKGRLAVVGKLE